MASGITDPTGGAPNFNIYDVFQSYGYTPTQAEIDALAPAFEGRKDVGETGRDAVANYVQAHQQVNGAQSLVQGNLQAETTGATNAQALGNQYESEADAMGNTAAGQYQQEIQTLQSAPKLFGGLTPDQVSQYLAPLQTQFNYGLGQVQGAAAQRGIAGSSLEAQAMAQAQQQYQQNVLSQGLNVGLNQQSLLANAYASLGGQQFGQAGQLYGQAGQQYGLAPQYLGLANSSAAQNTGLSEDLAQLPSQSANQAITQQALIQALNPQSNNSMWSWAAPLIGSAFGGLLNPANPGQGSGAGAALGGSLASTYTGDPRGAQTGQAFNTAMQGSPGAGQFMNYWQQLMGSGGGAGGAGAAGAGSSYLGGLSGGSGAAGGLMAVA